MKAFMYQAKEFKFYLENNKKEFYAQQKQEQIWFEKVNLQDELEIGAGESQGQVITVEVRTEREERLKRSVRDNMNRIQLVLDWMFRVGERVTTQPDTQISRKGLLYILILEVTGRVLCSISLLHIVIFN